MGLADRLEILYKERLEHESLIAKRPKAPDCDKTGSSTSGTSRALRFLGVCEAVLKKDVKSFRERLSAAAKLHLSLFERANRGEPIDWSYLTLLSYKNVFDALAACDAATAKQLAAAMGAKPELERRDHPFDQSLGAAVRAFVLADESEMSSRANEFAETCRKEGNHDFTGYATVFQAMVQGDTGLAQEGLAAVVKGHARQSKRGVFRDTEDEVLCVWGLAMANLARAKGLAVTGVPPLIPEDLVCR